MMEDMQAKAKSEKADESVAFAEFSQWCKMQQKSLGGTIKKSASAIDELGTSVQKLTEESKKLGEEISVLQGQVAKHEGDMKARENTREKEHAAYVAESTDYAESVSALQRAIEVMSSSQGDRSAASAALLQISQNSGVPDKAKDVIAAFLGESASSEDVAEFAAPEAHGYESQGGGIISMLKSLLDDFRAQKATCDKEEANTKHAHDMVMMDLKDAASGADKDASSKSSTKSKHQQKAALDKKQKRSTELVKAEDEGTLKDVEAECSEKTSSFEEKQQLRADEIEAIGKAISIMSSDDVGSFIESAAAAGKRMLASSAFAQLRSGSETAAQGRRHDVREFIVRESARLKSRSLSLLAERLEADPFTKIKGLIKGMVERLLKEANEDAEHEGFCDTEMGKSKATRTQLTEDIDSLTASVEDSKAEIMSLAESNSQLANSINDINAARAEAQKMRTAEKKKNKETVTDAEAAMKAVDAATAVLKDFYEKASQATALVQGGGKLAQKVSSSGIRMGSDEWDALADPNGKAVDKGHKDGQQTFGDKFTGNQDGATGVLAMIEVIRSDFSNLAADTKSAEEVASKSFEEFMVESKKNLAMKAKKMELNEGDKAAAEKKVSEDTKDLKSNQAELVAAETYFEKLEAQCIAKGSSFEDRTKARAAEIQSLKEALKMLD